jgi:FtsP/CotA-like multicopper oxidase with cupredoxin domain
MRMPHGSLSFIALSGLARGLFLAVVMLLAANRAGFSAATPSGEWIDPPALISANGVLDATLEAAPRTISLGGVPLDAMVFNGLYPGPLLRVRPGDLMRIKLVNHLNEPTNLHFHGIQTSPLANSDNVHVLVPPGASFQYEIRIPLDQPPGLYWYHAHAHGLATHQVTSGLSGPLIVEGIEASLPVSGSITERVFTLKDVEYEDSDDPVINDELHGLTQTINGQTRVALTMRPGEKQLWRFGNQSANLYFHLTLQGHRFRVVAEDGVVLRTPRMVDTIDIGPAARVEALVDAGEAGDYDLRSQKVLTGSAMSRTLGVLRVAGAVVAAAPAVTPAWQLEDLRQRAITARRTIIFSQDDATETYRINGRLFDHDHIDTRVPFGSTEEWTLRNDSDDMHVFHIHQLSFQVTAIDGKPVPFNGYLDVVRVPERGTVTILLPFTRPETIGQFVYHCHVLKHEDKGMMAQIEVFVPQSRWLAVRLLDRPIRWLRQRMFAFHSGLPVEFCGF